MYGNLAQLAIYHLVACDKLVTLSPWSSFNEMEWSGNNNNRTKKKNQFKFIRYPKPVLLFRYFLHILFNHSCCSLSPFLFSSTLTFDEYRKHFNFAVDGIVLLFKIRILDSTLTRKKSAVVKSRKRINSRGTYFICMGIFYTRRNAMISSVSSFYSYRIPSYKASK